MRILPRNLSKSDCGIIATFNAASWCKKEHSYSKIRKMASKHFEWSDKSGLIILELDNLLKKLKIPAKHVEKCVEDIQAEIYMGKAYLIGYRQNSEDFGHAIVVCRDKSGGIRIINAEHELMTWNELAAEIEAGGMDTIMTWELPNRLSL